MILCCTLKWVWSMPYQLKLPILPQSLSFHWSQLPPVTPCRFVVFCLSCSSKISETVNKASRKCFKPCKCFKPSRIWWSEGFTFSTEPVYIHLGLRLLPMILLPSTDPLYLIRDTLCSLPLSPMEHRYLQLRLIFTEVAVFHGPVYLFRDTLCSLPLSSMVHNSFLMRLIVCFCCLSLILFIS